MNTTPTPIRPRPAPTEDDVLDLSTRATARTQDLVLGASVWLREDTRLADGVVRVVPGVFAGYGYHRRRAAVIPNAQTDTTRQRTWVPLDDVIVRHWGDDGRAQVPRLATAPPALDPPEWGPLPFLLALALLVVLLAVTLWSVQP